MWLLLACRADPVPSPSPAPAEPPAPSTPAPPLGVTAADPPIVDPIGGSWITLSGVGFADPGLRTVTVGGAPVDGWVVRSDTELEVLTPPVAPGPADVVVIRLDAAATLADAVEAWSPAELPGARLFDASWGVEVGSAVTGYEWQRLTAELHPDWRVRDGHTVTWVPSEGRFVMVGGWNGEQEPVGFSPVPPGTAYPPENTTDEVWSSPDGVRWTLELPHQNGAFERRHAHNTPLWNDRLWMIGGDGHQGFYNHDVVSSADGLTWTVEVAEPPWSERALQVSGVYDGKLWMVGGQDLFGYPSEYTYHNDVWSSEDGVNWTEVASDAPASDTRWAGCGVLDGLVEFQGELWLVGCARYRDDAVGSSMSNEVWSTTDGVTWRRHADPPWAGKIWPNVVVWDDQLWILFGFTYGDSANGWPTANATEVWRSADGETWTALPHDSPVPGSHAQGVGVTPDALVLAGGNYSFGFGDGPDKSVWRLVPVRGRVVRTWTDRGADAVELTASAVGPLAVDDGFGPGSAGLWFDGSDAVLARVEAELLPDGVTALWVARAPHLPAPWGWQETYAPLGTVLGGPVDSGWMPRSSIGLSDGAVALVNLSDGVGSYGEPLWTRVTGGAGLQEGVGEVHLAGLTHAVDGTVQVYVDGAPAGSPVFAEYGAVPRGWSRVGGSLDDPYYGPNSRFAGTLGALIVLPEAVDPESVARIADWARGRFPVSIE
ncbi:MAG: IPT/TIG domain-containing protein [Myxococcota bacterium]